MSCLVRRKSPPVGRNESHLDRKMSLWPSSLLLTLPALLLLLLMHSECNAAVQPALHSSMPSITSVREMKTFSKQLTNDLHQVEKALAPLKTKQSQLEHQFKRYSARTARHGWHSALERRHNTDRLLRDAGRFRTNVQRLDRHLREQFGRKLSYVQGKPMRRYRDSSVTHQINQSVKVYKRIIELLINMIECPIYIMEELGGIGGQPDDDYSMDGDDGVNYDNEGSESEGEVPEGSDY